MASKDSNVVNALCSILDLGKSVPDHNGIWRGILHYHLGLVVPEVVPRHLRVKVEIPRCK